MLWVSEVECIQGGVNLLPYVKLLFLIWVFGLSSLLVAFGPTISVIYCYGPYQAKLKFWDYFFEMDFLREYKVIVRGDLNFNLNRDEVWEYPIRLDPMNEYFKYKIEMVGLIDLDPMKLVPTLRSNETR